MVSTYRWIFLNIYGPNLPPVEVEIRSLKFTRSELSKFKTFLLNSKLISWAKLEGKIPRQKSYFDKEYFVIKFLLLQNSLQWPRVEFCMSAFWMLSCDVFWIDVYITRCWAYITKLKCILLKKDRLTSKDCHNPSLLFIRDCKFVSTDHLTLVLIMCP